MKTIAEEIKTFLEETGHSQAMLARSSDVFPSTICNLVKGNRQDVSSRTADALRMAMKKLRPRKKKQPATEMEV